MEKQLNDLLRCSRIWNSILNTLMKPKSFQKKNDRFVFNISHQSCFTSCNFWISLCIINNTESFIKLFQVERPLPVFLYEHLQSLLNSVLKCFMRSEVRSDTRSEIRWNTTPKNWWLLIWIMKKIFYQLDQCRTQGEKDLRKNVNSQSYIISNFLSQCT